MKRCGDVIILGGGVIGLTTAYFLAREGVEVVLCERGKVGQEASWAGAGILPPSDMTHAQHPTDRLRALSGTLFPALSQELLDRTGIDNGYVRCGGLEFVSRIGEVDTLEWYGRGVLTERISALEVLRLEPALSPHLGQAIHVPGMAQLRNPRHLKALRQACLASKKVTFLEDTPVQHLQLVAGRIQAVHTSHERLQADAILLAAGAWTGALLEPLGCRLNIKPVRGQMILFNPGAVLLRHVLMWGPCYLVPRLDGRILVGSTEENVGFTKETTVTAIQGLHALGLKLVPCLAGAPVEKTWAGLRPGSPDGLPYLGKVPGVENLHVAAGHFRAGIQLSPGTALLLKEQIMGQSLSLALEAFRLDR